MALDPQNGKMYWTEPGLQRIRRANLDGSGPLETLVSTSDHSGGIALDVSGGKMYLADGRPGSGKIRRANLDGSNPEDLATAHFAAGIAVDNLHGKLHWSDLEGHLDGSGRIMRSNLDGSNIETIHTGIDEANGLAVDPIGGKLYWPELTTKRIQRSNLDGTGIEDIAVNLLNPTTVGLDFAAGKIYWTDSFGGPAANPLNRIERANFDGSNRELVVSGVGLPWGIAVVPEPSAGLLSLIAIAGWLVRAAADALSDVGLPSQTLQSLTVSDQGNVRRYPEKR